MITQIKMQARHRRQWGCGLGIAALDAATYILGNVSAYESTSPVLFLTFESA
jgi:hypothetical protein